ncbi:iron-containing alcohol dehydrogenase [Arthrobacter sp. W4I7]|uniref:iron-containing alcohol dehydrogenase n=1 Tax=Arthrobacter sp. W4I7 TaxID=3042296 RepID=UPI002780FBC2|nr:iron-containing alcohol dehydrogenase [Arthrobacter sp. W4I7]MDQ0691364.1 alcohol dehydrogenase class IV [Arthrobacter sp. W4I7]
MSQNWFPKGDAPAQFLAPAAIFSGRGTSGQIASILKSHLQVPAGPVLVAADDAVLDAGLLTGLLDDLREGGFDVTLTSGFGAEPSSETIDAAAAVAREASVQAVIGVGGGSVLDSSKLLALMVRNEGGSADWVGVVDPPNGVAPLILVPSTCGTGSEATRIAMVTVEGSKRASSCAKYVPSVAVLDPDLVATLPPRVVASTGMDALAHAIESVMSTNSSPWSVHHAMRAIELLVANLESAAAGDADARANCLWASHLAGQALNAGVVLGHSIAYCLAHEVPMPHGTSCALALPYCMAYNQTIDSLRSEALALTITGGASTQMWAAATSVMQMAVRLGLPVTLDEAGIPADAEGRMAQLCVREYPRPNNPEPLDEENLTELLKAMRTGDLDAAFKVTARPT